MSAIQNCVLLSLQLRPVVENRHSTRVYFSTRSTRKKWNQQNIYA